MSEIEIEIDLDQPMSDSLKETSEKAEAFDRCLAALLLPEALPDVDIAMIQRMFGELKPAETSGWSAAAPALLRNFDELLVKRLEAIDEERKDKLAHYWTDCFCRYLHVLGLTYHHFKYRGAEGQEVVDKAYDDMERFWATRPPNDVWPIEMVIPEKSQFKCTESAAIKALRRRHADSLRDMLENVQI